LFGEQIYILVPNQSIGNHDRILVLNFELKSFSIPENYVSHIFIYKKRKKEHLFKNQTEYHAILLRVTDLFITTGYLELYVLFRNTFRFRAGRL